VRSLFSFEYFRLIISLFVLFTISTSFLFFLRAAMKCLLAFLFLALCSGNHATQLTRSVQQRMVLAYIADTFANKGFLRADPFEPSPAQMVEIDAQIKQLITNTFEQMKSDAAVASQFSNDVTKEAEAQNSVEPASPGAVLASITEELSAPVLPPQPQQQLQEPRLPEEKAQLEQQTSSNAGLVEIDAMASRHLRGRGFGGLKKAYKALGKAAKGAVKDFAHLELTGDLDKFKGQVYEDCMACRFIWKQVEMDVSNARYIEDVQASFEHNCLDAQKSSIFYKACEDMYDDMYAMSDDYMSSDYTVDKMCQRANMCKK